MVLRHRQAAAYCAGTAIPVLTSGACWEVVLKYTCDVVAPTCCHLVNKARLNNSNAMREPCTARSRHLLCPSSVHLVLTIIFRQCKMDRETFYNDGWGWRKLSRFHRAGGDLGSHSYSPSLGVESTHSKHGCVDALPSDGAVSGGGAGCASACNLHRLPCTPTPCPLARNHHQFTCTGKVHGSLARAGKVRGQTPKVEKQEKKKTPKGRAKKRLVYTRRFLNVGAC